MNFLSHYYLLPQKEKLDLVVGNLLPDLMRGFTKIYHRDVKPNKSIHDTDLVQGIHYHLQTDALFHKHQFFISHCENLKKISDSYDLPMTKNYIVSHVMLELLIDSYLMDKDDDLADKFYHSLAQAHDEHLEEKIKMTVSGQNSSKIIGIFKGFTESKYAYSLQKKNGIQDALYHIIGRRIGLSFSEKNWQKAIDEGKERISEDLPFFLKQLNEKLNDA